MLKRGKHGQRGVSLLITLVMLVIMTLGAIAMVRSLDATTLIAGNLAFRQSATNSGDAGVQAAVAWLSTASTAVLTCQSSTGVSVCPDGYQSNGADPTDPTVLPTAGQSWDAYWNANLKDKAVSLPEDATGNTVSYFIHRLCAGTGAMTAAGANCVETPSVASAGGYAKRQGAAKFQASSQVYYRVTIRVQGKRNTVSYVQAFVAQ